MRGSSAPSGDHTELISLTSPEVKRDKSTTTRKGRAQRLRHRSVGPAAKVYHRWACSQSRVSYSEAVTFLAQF